MTTPSPLRPWVRDHPDRKVHGVVWLTDEQALERLELGQAWTPLAGAKALTATLRSER